MTEPLTIELAGRAAEVELRVHSRAHPGGLATFDHNWLNVELIVRGEAGWRCPAFMRARDFARFARQLIDLEHGAVAGATLEPTDPWVEVALSGAGDVDVSGVFAARDIGTEKVVESAIELDRTSLARLREQIEAVAVAYPPLD